MSQENICKKSGKKGGACIQRLLNTAFSEVGYLEKASNANLDSKTANPGKNNYTKYARDMSRYHKGIYANGYAWCDTFVDWCFVKAYGHEKAIRLIYGWSAYTPTSAQYFKNNGRWRTDALPGDVVFFKDKYGTICHTGIVYDTDERYIYTIEGNTSCQSGVVANGGGVAKKIYKKDYGRIAGYARPDYSIVEEQNSIKEEKRMYNKISDCPLWAQDYVKTAFDKGYIKGNSSGNLDLDDTKIWCLVVMLRIAGIMA